ncbi:MAG: methionyl-tRNA formyltransferase [Candidatus Gastranaerophilaceae bacterium]
MRVVILGKGLMLANIVLGAIDAGADIAGVFRYEQTSTNPIKLLIQDIFNPPPEVSLFKQLKLNQIRMKSANSREFRKLLINLNVDLVIVGTWKERIRKDTYIIPKIGTINVHPSLLPKYRGPNPYLQTILNGETESGVTLHLLDDNYDSGAILAQEKIKILNTDTSKELRERSAITARKMVTELIKDLDTKIITPIKQNEKYATYYPNISGNEKMLDFKYQTSDEISRTIRALHPFLPTYITHFDKFFIVNPYDFKIVKNDVDTAISGNIIHKDAKTKSLTILCKDEKAIKFNNLKLYKSELLTEKYINDVVRTTF